MTQPQAELELRSVDPGKGRARRYQLTMCRSLFGGSALLISWGRIGRPPRVRLETFATLDALEARRAELLARRRAHGYVIAAHDPHAPHAPPARLTA